MGCPEATPLLAGFTLGYWESLIVWISFAAFGSGRKGPNNLCELRITHRRKTVQEKVVGSLESPQAIQPPCPSRLGTAGWKGNPG